MAAQSDSRRLRSLSGSMETIQEGRTRPVASGEITPKRMLLLLALALVSLVPSIPAHLAYAASPTATVNLQLADVTKVYGSGFSQLTEIRPTRTSAPGWLPFREPASAAASHYVDGYVVVYSRGCTEPKALTCIEVTSAVFRYSSASYVREEMQRMRIVLESHLQPVTGVGDEALLQRVHKGRGQPTLLVLTFRQGPYVGQVGVGGEAKEQRSKVLRLAMVMDARMQRARSSTSPQTPPSPRPATAKELIEINLEFCCPGNYPYGLPSIGASGLQLVNAKRQAIPAATSHPTYVRVGYHVGNVAGDVSIPMTRSWTFQTWTGSHWVIWGKRVRKIVHVVNLWNQDHHFRFVLPERYLASGSPRYRVVVRLTIGSHTQREAIIFPGAVPLLARVRVQRG